MPKKPRCRLLRALVICLIILALFVGVTSLFFAGLRPNLLAMGETLLASRAVEIMNQSVNLAMEQQDNLQNMILVEKNNQGNIAMLAANSELLNDISSCATLDAQEKLAQMGIEELGVPLGNLIGSEFFTGMGPMIYVRAYPMGAVNAEFVSDFVTSGINQTRIRIYMIMNANMRLVVGTGTQEVQVTTQVLIAENIIVGAVPDTYANLPTENDFLNLLP